MPNYRSREYRNLVAAEKLLVVDMQSAEPEDRTSIVTTLVKVIDMKRIMRGVGNPKPQDYSKRKRRVSANSTPAVPTDVVQPGVQPGHADPGASVSGHDSSDQSMPKDS